MPLLARILATVLAGAVVVGGLIAGVDGWPAGGEPSLLTAFPDCEAPSAGLIGQPTAAWTSFAFVAVGIWIVGDRRLSLATDCSSPLLSELSGSAASWGMPP